MSQHKLTYPAIVWTQNFIARDKKQTFAAKSYIEKGYFDGARIIDRNGMQYRVNSSSCGRIYFEDILSIVDSVFPKSRSYQVELDLSNPEQLDLEETKRAIIDCILENRWHHLGQGISSDELLAPIRAAESFEELVDDFDTVFGN